MSPMRLLWYWWQSEYMYILDPWGIYDIEIYMIQYDPIYWIPPNRKRFGSRSARYLGWLIVASNGPQRLGTWGSFILVDPTFISMIQYDVIKIDLSSLFTGYPKDIQRPIQKKRLCLHVSFKDPTTGFVWKWATLVHVIPYYSYYSYYSYCSYS